MRTQRDVESILQRLYQRIGRNPSELLQGRLIDGGWDNALSYEITRSDMKRARIYQRDLDDQNEQEIEGCLHRFVQLPLPRTFQVRNERRMHMLGRGRYAVANWMRSALTIIGASIAAFFLQGCELSISDDYKQYMCSEAERGAAFRCNYLGVAEETCTDIAGEAFRLCYDSMPEKYVR